MRLHFALPIALFGICVFVASKSSAGGGGGPPPDPAIAYASGGLRVMNADGSNSRLVVQIKAHDAVGAPSWSPDSTKLAFHGRLQGGEGIWTVNLDGTGLQRIVPLTGAFFPFPDWSQAPTPDGQYKIVFESDDDIWIVNSDGSELQNLTNSPSDTEVDAGWTRDGAGIFVTRVPPPGGGPNDYSLVQLDVAVAAGGGLEITNETVIRSGSAFIGSPRSSNVNDFVAYFSPGDDSTNPTRAWMIDLASASWTPDRISNYSGTNSEHSPTFSPDDTKVAFERGGAIYTINVEGTGETRISRNGAYPAWRRR